MTTDNKKIAVIVRASTDAQETASQKKEIIDYCINTLGYTADEIDDELEFSGASATEEKEQMTTQMKRAKAKYNEMLTKLKNKVQNSPTINAVAVWHINRLGRTESKLMDLKEWFVKNKIQLYIKNPSLTLLDDNRNVNAGTAIAYSVLAATVRIETDEMLAKMQRGKQRNRDAGMIADGGIPYGFIKGIDKRLAPDPETAQRVVKMFNMYADGETASHIRDFLSSYGFSTSTTHIYRMLKNERYRTLVGDELFDKVRAIAFNNRTKQTANERLYNFGQKLIRCAHCGRHYTSNRGYYYCIGTQSKFKDTNLECKDGNNVVQYRIDSCLMYATQIIFTQYSALNQTDRKAEIEQMIADYRKKLDVVNNRLSEYDEQIADAHVAKILNKKHADKFDRLIEKLKEDNIDDVKEQQRLQTQITALTDELQMTGDYADSILVKMNNAKTELNNKDKKELYDLVHRMIKDAVIGNIGDKYRYLTVESAVTEHQFMFVWCGSGQGFKFYQLRDEDSIFENKRAIKINPKKTVDFEYYMNSDNVTKAIENGVAIDRTKDSDFKIKY